MMDEAATALLADGATHLLLACTELPIAAAGASFEPRCLDATRALAEYCIAWSTGLAPAPVATIQAEDGSWTSDGSRIS